MGLRSGRLEQLLHLSEEQLLPIQSQAHIARGSRQQREVAQQNRAGGRGQRHGRQGQLQIVQQQRGAPSAVVLPRRRSGAAADRAQCVQPVSLARVLLLRCSTVRRQRPAQDTRFRFKNHL